MHLEKLLPVFLAEADEHLQALEEGVLLLERHGADPQLVQALFRSAHTLKGSASALGLRRIADLTHRMESLLEDLRSGHRTPEGLADLLLACVDALRSLRQEVAETGQERTPVDALLERLNGWRRTGPGHTPDGLLPVEVRIRLRNDCPMPAARAIALLHRLRGEGTVEWADPSEEQLIQGSGASELVCRARVRQPEVLQDVLSDPDVEWVRVLPAQDEPVREERWLDLGPQARGKLYDDPEVLRRHAMRTVRVDVERLDRLMNLVGELVADRIRFQQIAQRLRVGDRSQALAEELAEASTHLGRVASDLQAQILKARMLPIEHLFSRFPRYVRDLSQRAGKQVELVLEGQDTELDRSVIEQIGGPLMHLVRNAVDHGIEPPAERERAGKPPTGRLRLAAAQEEDAIVVIVEDDGQGIDTERVRHKAAELGLLTPDQAHRLSEEEAIELVFHPGLSTASAVTDVSGRGVGMDAVRAAVQAIGGSVTVETDRGRGTRVLLRLPLTLAIVRALLVGCGGERYALPLVAVHEIVEIPVGRIHRLGPHRSTLLRGSVLPLVSLHEALRLPTPEQHERALCVVVGVGRRRIGLVVDRVIGEQEIVVKPLQGSLADAPGVAGATILGDGRVALILDPAALIRLVAREEGSVDVGEGHGGGRRGLHARDAARDPHEQRV
jgi:two-component system chemotaxis sensor kinase CheA